MITCPRATCSNLWVVRRRQRRRRIVAAASRFFLLFVRPADVRARHHTKMNKKI